MAEYLFGFAFLAYAGAAIAYALDARRPGPAGRVATWAGSLNLFVWLVVSVYLVWGCRTRYRLLGLAVMPVAAGLLVLARLGGGIGEGGTSGYSTTFLIVHVGLLSF